MSVVAIKQYTNFLASVVCDINLKLSRNKGGPKQHNIVFHYCLNEIMPLDFRTSQLHQKCKFKLIVVMPNLKSFTKSVMKLKL